MQRRGSPGSATRVRRGRCASAAAAAVWVVRVNLIVRVTALVMARLGNIERIMITNKVSHPGPPRRASTLPRRPRHAPYGMRLCMRTLTRRYSTARAARAASGAAATACSSTSRWRRRQRQQRHKCALRWRCRERRHAMAAATGVVGSGSVAGNEPRCHHPCPIPTMVAGHPTCAGRGFPPAAGARGRPL